MNPNILLAIFSSASNRENKSDSLCPMAQWLTLHEEMSNYKNVANRGKTQHTLSIP